MSKTRGHSLSHNFHIAAILLQNTYAILRYMEGIYSVKRILIVEDELHISQLITYNLTKAGYLTAPAFDGREALSQVESFAPHLITLDLLLPLHSGWEVLDFIRKHPRKQIATLPVIVLSALYSSQLQAELRHNGVEHCLGKPFSVTEFCLLVRSILEKPRDMNWASPL